MESQQNGHVPEFAVAALQAAITSLECGATDEEVDQAFVTVYNALARLGRRDAAIDPDGALNADQQEMWDLVEPQVSRTYEHIMQDFAELARRDGTRRRAIATQLADHQARGLQDARRVQC